MTEGLKKYKLTDRGSTVCLEETADLLKEGRMNLEYFQVNFYFKLFSILMFSLYSHPLGI